MSQPNKQGTDLVPTRTLTQLDLPGDEQTANFSDEALDVHCGALAKARAAVTDAYRRVSVERVRRKLRIARAGGSDEPIAIIEESLRESAERSGARRVRWSVEQLLLIAALAERERDQAVTTADAQTLQAIIENATRLVAARISPHSDENADGAKRAQVAYQIPLVVLVDLDTQTVERTVLLDEQVELDSVDGVRSEGSLQPLTPQDASKALAIAQDESEPAPESPWPAYSYGW
jgi:hypothetical protein